MRPSIDPRDIALSEKLITEFDSTQAFFIGFLAGLKINKQSNPHEKHINRSFLRIVK